MISTRLLRRLWILPVSIVLVAAIAYAVAGVQSSTYTATSTVVVSSVPGAVSASNSSGAGSLASTYAGALPSDGALQAYVSRTAHVAATNNAIKAGAPRGSAITFTFTAPTRAAAIAGGRALASGLTAAKPVSPTVSAGTLKLVQTPTTATATAAGSYRSKVVVLVPASGGPTEGINPSDAGHLATTYAAIIPADDKLLLAASRATRLPVSQIASDLSVVNEQNTSLLQVGFKASNAHDANAGARVIAQLISGPNPVARGIIPSSVQEVSLPAVIPSNTPVSSGGSSTKPIVIGGVIGLLLGIVLLIGWERSDPRISDARGLSSVLGCPATPAERLSPDAAYALLERWRSLTDQVPARVAILPADDASAEHADAVIDALIAGGHGDVSFVDARSGELPERLGHDAATDPRVPISLISAGAPGQGGAGEAVALGCDLAVVVVRDGARAANIRRLGDELGNFGVVPAWALLSSRATLKRASARHDTPRHAVSA
ncbi:MAG: hypothetical protein WBQ18_00485 [Solirubrobacteraceae bacterium]